MNETRRRDATRRAGIVITRVDRNLEEDQVAKSLAFKTRIRRDIS